MEVQILCVRCTLLFLFQTFRSRKAVFLLRAMENIKKVIMYGFVMERLILPLRIFLVHTKILSINLKSLSPEVASPSCQRTESDLFLFRFEHDLMQ